MWRRQDEAKPSFPSGSPAPPASLDAPDSRMRASGPLSPEATCIGGSLKIKGEITGREDLLLDGEVQGTVRVESGKVTVGSQGRVSAQVEADEIVVYGDARGALNGRMRVEVSRSGCVHGDIATMRLCVEEGAVVNGRVEMGRAAQAAAFKARAMAAGATSSGEPSSAPLEVKEPLP